jgi:Zn-dependent protease
MNFGGNWVAALYEASTWVVPVIIAVTFHEAAHGFVAHRFGDDTALVAGRVTFNPLKHIDPFGTVLLPALLLVTSGFLFGYAKPVPVNFGRLHHPRRDMVLVALAGPLTNVLLAIASSLLFYTVDFTPRSIEDWLARNLVNSLQINVVLCVFNMLPIPPLDGGRVAVGILPRFLAYPLARLEPYGMLILMLIFILSYAGARSVLGFSLLGWLISGPAEALIRFVLTVTGQSG